MKRKVPNGLEQFNNFLQELRQHDTDGLLQNMSPTFTERLQMHMNRVIGSLSKYFLERESKFFSQHFRRAFRKIKGDLPSHNVGLSKYSLQKLYPKFEKDYKAASNMSLGLIYTQNDENMLKIRRRFQDWVVTKSMKDEKGNTLNQKDLLPRNSQIKFILRDQTNKLSATIDDIVAKEYKAIAFQWKTRNDNRVVGKPGGKYPNVNNSDKMHGNHWSRRDKYFYYPDSWAVKQGLIKKTEFESSSDDILDGMPGKPIGCRCYSKNIYRIQDLPRQFLTKKGIDYLQK